MRPTGAARSRTTPSPPRNLRVSKLVCRGEIPNRNLAIALTNLRRLCLKHQESQDHIKEVYEYADRFRDGSQEATPTIKIRVPTNGPPHPGPLLPGGRGRRLGPSSLQSCRPVVGSASSRRLLRGGLTETEHDRSVG